MGPEMIFSIKLSFIVGTLATLFVFLLGTPLAYIFAYKKMYFKKFWELILTLPLVLPPTVTGYYLLVLFGKEGIIGKSLGLSLVFSWQGAVLASFVVSFPLFFRAAISAFKSISPEMRQSSFILGHSEWATALKISLPLAKNGIISGLILCFARSIGEFGATLMLAGNITGKTNTMPLSIYSLFSSGNIEKANSLIIILTIISAVFLFCAQQLIKDIRND